MLVSELCAAPYNTSSMILFMTANHTNYHHFFIRSCSMLTQKDLDDFILNNFEFVESLVKVFGSPKLMNKVQQKSSLDDNQEDEEEDHFV